VTGTESSALPLALSVVVLTRNRREELLRSLAALRQQDLPFELVVVDNASADGTADAVRRDVPHARIVELPRNEGVPGGRNRGVEAATGDLLVFLDDDAGFESRSALRRLRARFDRDPELGIAATLSRLAASGAPEHDAIPRRHKRLAGGDCPVSYFCGVAFAVRREVFTRIGPLREDLFYVGEELDFSWRALAAGYHILWVPEVVVLHRRSELERPAGRWIRFQARNRLRLALLHLPWRYVASYAVVWCPWLLLRALRYRRLADLTRGIADFARMLPATLRARDPLPPRVVRAIAELDGRLLY
jgi:GT2 family glycosyltransferase